MDFCYLKHIENKGLRQFPCFEHQESGRHTSEKYIGISMFWYEAESDKQEVEQEEIKQHWEKT